MLVNRANIQFSIIIPIYNTDLLGELLQSFYNQTYNRKLSQLVIVDDGSSINYKKEYERILKKYQMLDIKYEYIGDKKGRFRVNTARNKGLKHIKYDHIIYIDGDSILPEYYLSNLYNIVQKTTNDIIIGESVGYNYNDIAAINASDISEKKYTKYCDNELYRDFRSSGDFKHLWHVFLGGNFYIHRNNLEKILPWHEGLDGWGEDDIDFAFRAYKLGLSFGMHKDIEVYNIKTSARMTREKFHSIMKNQYTLYIEYARDAEYLEYMLQRFHNTPEEFKNDNIPINFKKEILD